MLYQLMNKDVVVATYEEQFVAGRYTYKEVNRFDQYLPHGFTTIDGMMAKDRLLDIVKNEELI